MIQRVSHASVYVLDQDRAKDFYTEKLGFELRADVTMGPFRWLTVAPKGQPDFELILMPLKPTPMMDEATCNAIRELVQKGMLGADVFATADCRKTYEELKTRATNRQARSRLRSPGPEARPRGWRGGCRALPHSHGSSGFECAVQVPWS